MGKFAGQSAPIRVLSGATKNKISQAIIIMEAELKERLITIYQMLKAFRAEAQYMIHRQRNYRLEHILATMETWRRMDKDQPTEKPIENDEIPF